MYKVLFFPGRLNLRVFVRFSGCKDGYSVGSEYSQVPRVAGDSSTSYQFANACWLFNYEYIVNASYLF